MISKKVQTFIPRLPWWGADLQTLRNTLRPPKIQLEDGPRLTFNMTDGSGDRLVASVHHSQDSKSFSRPLVVLIHGMGGTEDSHYISMTAHHMLKAGFNVMRLNLRGAGPASPLCTSQYHGGKSEDLKAVADAIPEKYTSAGIFAVGYSLGANMLLKFMAEYGSRSRNPIIGAAAVSAPIDLASCSRAMLKRRNYVYTQYLLHSLKKAALQPHLNVPEKTRQEVKAARSVLAFDECYTGPMNSFRDADHYYRESSSENFVLGIKSPTLIIHALDDPWIPAEGYHRLPWHNNPKLKTAIVASGGHLGFHGRRAGFSGSDSIGSPWYNGMILEFLRALA